MIIKMYKTSFHLSTNNDLHKKSFDQINEKERKMPNSISFNHQVSNTCTKLRQGNKNERKEVGSIKLFRIALEKPTPTQVNLDIKLRQPQQ